MQLLNFGRVMGFFECVFVCMCMRERVRGKEKESEGLFSLATRTRDFVSLCNVT